MLGYDFLKNKILALRETSKSIKQNNKNKN
jgi:hypothetical protein